VPPSITTPLALTVGDPSGIGPEIAIKAWLARQAHGCPAFYVIGDPALIAARARTIGIDLSIVETGAADAAAVFQTALPVAPLSRRLFDRPGDPSPENAAGIVEAIDRAVADVFDGHAAALVTLPVAKKLLYDAGFAFPGHTEYLAHLACERTGWTVTPVMMLAGPELKTVPVTIHIPLAQVPSVFRPN